MKNLIPGQFYDVIVEIAEPDTPDVTLPMVEYIGLLDAEQVFRNADGTLEAMFTDEIVQVTSVTHMKEAA